jgi:hypothetical protein
VSAGNQSGGTTSRSAHLISVGAPDAIGAHRHFSQGFAGSQGMPEPGVGGDEVPGPPRVRCVSRRRRMPTASGSSASRIRRSAAAVVRRPARRVPAATSPSGSPIGSFGDLPRKLPGQRRPGSRPAAWNAEGHGSHEESL